MPHPLKHRSALGEAFKAAEDRLDEAIRDRFHIKSDVLEIKRVDRARSSPPSAAPSAPKTGLGRSSKGSNRWQSSSRPGRPTKRPTRSPSATRNWTPSDPPA
jgi:hypothetical protein